MNAPAPMKREARHWGPDALYDVHPEDLSAMARLLYGALTRCVTKGQAKPSIRRLATMTAMSRSSIKRAMAELESARLVVTTERSGAVSSYRLTPVEEWRVRWTGSTQKPVEDSTRSTQNPVEDSTGSTGEADRVHANLEPGPQGTTLGSTAGSTAGSGADASALSKRDREDTEAIKTAGLTADETTEFVVLREGEPGTPAPELIGKSRRAVARRRAEVVGQADDGPSLSRQAGGRTQ